MAWLQRLFAGKKPASSPPPPIRPAPNWLEVDGEYVDLNTLTPEQLAKLEAVLLLRRQQREVELTDYLVSLAAERARLLAARDYQLWLMTLKLMFGEDIGRRVAAQDIVPGMQLQHLILSFGQPDLVEAGSAGLALVYGSREAGSYFELAGDVVSGAYIGGRPALPFARGGGEGGA